jgi:hypothetical protein
MTIAAIGYEGSRREGVPVHWGVAALAVEEHIFNALTRARSTRDRFEELKAEGHVTSLERPVEIPEGHEGNPIVLVEIDRYSPHFSHLRCDPGRAGGLIANSLGRLFQVYAFDSETSFDAYCRDVRDRVMRHVFYESPNSAELVRIARLLLVQDPDLNALWVAMAPPEARDLYLSVAKANLRGAEASERFDAQFEAFTYEKGVVEVEYDGGLAEGGGLDIGPLAQVLRGADDLHSVLAPEVVNDAPYLRTPPSFRLGELRPGSAHLHFQAAVKGRPWGERVARYLELKRFQTALATGSGVPSTARVDRALVRVRAPDANTRTFQTSLSGERKEIGASGGAVTRATNRSDAMTFLAIQSGLIKLARDVEVSLFPTSRGRHMISTVDNGNGSAPDGVADLQRGRELLFRPALYSLMFERAEGAKPKTYLRRVSPLPSTMKGSVSAVPSSVADGVWIYGLDIAVERPDPSTIVTEIGTFQTPRTIDVKGSHDWLSGWRIACLEFELLLPKSGRRGFKFWIGTADRRPSSLLRILMILREHGGRLHQTSLVAKASERAGHALRINNTRREVLKNPELLEFSSDDNQTVVATERGQLYLEAYLRIFHRLSAS